MYLVSMLVVVQYFRFDAVGIWKYLEAAVMFVNFII